MSGGLRGFVAQGMDGRKKTPLPRLIVEKDTSGASDSYTATGSCVVEVYAWGGGATGAVGGANQSGGGGAAAGYKRLRLAAGQPVSWTAAAAATATTGSGDGFDGHDTTLRLPTGLSLVAGGGKKGISGSGSVSGGAGGVCSAGWDIVRSGGAGGDCVAGVGTAGGAGQFGGAGGGSSGSAAGGGAGGFSDRVSGSFPSAGNGGFGNSTGLSQTAPGGGSASTTSATGGAGSAGRVLVFVYTLG